jgi:hypothetical protein
VRINIPITAYFTVVRAGVSTDFGGQSNKGAVFVRLKIIKVPPDHPDHPLEAYYEVKAPWGNQALAAALAAITTGKNVLAEVGTGNEEKNPLDYYCYKLYVTTE